MARLVPIPRGLADWATEQVFRFAFEIAIPSAAVAACLKALDLHGPPGFKGFAEGLVNDSAFSSFTYLIGLFVAFRAQQAYSRFWSGAGTSFGIMADFFDVASSLVAFTRGSRLAPLQVQEFHHMVIRLFSLLHALILADLESEGEVSGQEMAFKYELIDIEGIDASSLNILQAADKKVDLVFQWIQALIVDAQQSGVLSAPPPILTRAFQELNSGMVQFHRALTLSEVSFPFPYTAATQVVLIIHWMLTPFVASAWSKHIWSCAGLAFIQVFMLWTLNAIAQELENPFGVDKNDLQMEEQHKELNSRLLLLLDQSRVRVPHLAPHAALDLTTLVSRKSKLRSLGSMKVRPDPVDDTTDPDQSLLCKEGLEGKADCESATDRDPSMEEETLRHVAVPIADDLLRRSPQQGGSFCEGSDPLEELDIDLETVGGPATAALDHASWSSDDIDLETVRDPAPAPVSREVQMLQLRQNQSSEPGVPQESVQNNGCWAALPSLPTGCDGCSFKPCRDKAFQVHPSGQLANRRSGQG